MYIGTYLFYCGLAPAVILAFVLLRTEETKLRMLFQGSTNRWWLYAGIMLQLLYGLTMATKHMMFSFRYFVPYIPATVLMVAGLLQNTSSTRGNKTLYSRRGTAMLNGFILCLFLFQAYQVAHTYNKSVNVFGEYRGLSIRDYQAFIDTLRRQSQDTGEHWESVRSDHNRPPRVHTYAAGVLPYVFRDSYVYSSLISYRHGDSEVDQVELKRSADYIHILAPRHGAAERQLPLPLESYSLVSSYELSFDGHNEMLLVYYNPDPEPHRLSARIGESR